MKRNVIYTGELIGQKIEIVDATNQAQQGLLGTVVDETKSTIHVNVNGDVKVLLKRTITFKLVKTGELIDGSTIVRRPEDRIKGK